jgi:hypothetical protein
MGLLPSARAMDGEIPDSSNSRKDEKKEDRVERTSYTFKPLNRRSRRVSIPASATGHLACVCFARFLYTRRQKSANRAEEAGSTENAEGKCCTGGNPQGAQLPLRVLSLWAGDFRVRDW